MNVRETSLQAYDALRCGPKLQRREVEVLTAAYEHFGRTAFTRKELTAALGWPVNCVTGRVLSLVQRGEIEELNERRDGGYLLRVAAVQRELALA